MLKLTCTIAEASDYFPYQTESEKHHHVGTWKLHRRDDTCVSVVHRTRRCCYGSSSATNCPSVTYHSLL
ncbi:hypothetical protein GWI33_007327 [Rhynchophorus ferrugineus]|uniref:Uncharacterized protein n=1 Tax=Rhynchophorus ferrugineus TaxID=354439 RepID=A0A834IKH7_RHYFE|nr:hypothetical protein GWI33_007327 [Rhynchophorus ferrugineus]